MSWSHKIIRTKNPKPACPEEEYIYRVAEVFRDCPEEGKVLYTADPLTLDGCSYKDILWMLEAIQNDIQKDPWVYEWEEARGRFWKVERIHGGDVDEPED